MSGRNRLAEDIMNYQIDFFDLSRLVIHQIDGRRCTDYREDFLDLASKTDEFNPEEFHKLFFFGADMEFVNDPQIIAVYNLTHILPPTNEERVKKRANMMVVFQECNEENIYSMKIIERECEIKEQVPDSYARLILRYDLQQAKSILSRFVDRNPCNHLLLASAISSQYKFVPREFVKEFFDELSHKIQDSERIKLEELTNSMISMRKLNEEIKRQIRSNN